MCIFLGIAVCFEDAPVNLVGSQIQVYPGQVQRDWKWHWAKWEPEIQMKYMCVL